ncbi:MAG: DUF6051 family protein, partial [Spirochaetaceae bacterium]
ADPDYDYSHEQPFPDRAADPEAVDRYFREIMRRAAGFLAPNIAKA